jgi:hypothetical protein
MIRVLGAMSLRYRESGTSEWKTIPVTPSGSTTVTINNLTPSTLYEFQVIGKNALGEGMLSKVITVRTLGNENCIYVHAIPQPVRLTVNLTSGKTGI